MNWTPLAKAHLLLRWCGKKQPEKRKTENKQKKNRRERNKAIQRWHTHRGSKIPLFLYVRTIEHHSTLLSLPWTILMIAVMDAVQRCLMFKEESLSALHSIHFVISFSSSWTQSEQLDSSIQSCIKKEMSGKWMWLCFLMLTCSPNTSSSFRMFVINN